MDNFYMNDIFANTTQKKITDDELEERRIKLLEDIKKSEELAKRINFNVGTIHNAGTILHNKLIELSNKFIKHGLLFRESDEKVSQSFVGKTIENELFEYFIDAEEMFSLYYSCLKIIYADNQTSYNMVQILNFIKKRLIVFGLNNKESKVIISEDDRRLLKIFLEIYKKLTNLIFNYEINDDFVYIIIKKIVEYERSVILTYDDRDKVINSSTELLELQVIPELEMLGYFDIAQTLDEEWMNLKKSKGRTLTYGKTIF